MTTRIPVKNITRRTVQRSETELLKWNQTMYLKRNMHRKVQPHDSCNKSMQYTTISTCGLLFKIVSQIQIHIILWGWGFRFRHTLTATSRCIQQIPRLAGADIAARGVVALVGAARGTLQAFVDISSKVTVSKCDLSSTKHLNYICTERRGHDF